MNDIFFLNKRCTSQTILAIHTIFSAKSKDLVMLPAFLHMENHCELVYVLLFQLLKFMEIKIGFKCSFYKDCQTRILLGEGRWQHSKGGIDLFLLLFLFQYDGYYILYFR